MARDSRTVMTGTRCRPELDPNSGRILAHAFGFAPFPWVSWSHTHPGLGCKNDCRDLSGPRISDVDFEALIDSDPAPGLQPDYRIMAATIRGNTRRAFAERASDVIPPTRKSMLRNALLTLFRAEPGYILT